MIITLSVEYIVRHKQDLYVPWRVELSVRILQWKKFECNEKHALYKILTR